MKQESFRELLKQHGIKFTWEFVSNDLCDTFGSDDTKLFRRMILSLDEKYLDNIKNPDSYIKNVLRDLFAIEDIDKRFYNSCIMLVDDDGKKYVEYCYKSDFNDICIEKWIESLSVSKLEGLLEHVKTYKEELSGINHILNTINKYEDSSMTIKCNKSDDKFISTLSISGYKLEFDVFIKEDNKNVSANICIIKGKEIDDIIESIYVLIISKYNNTK